MAKMNEQEYAATQQVIGVLSVLVQKLDLPTFLDMARRADEIGPFMDPTLWMKGNKQLQSVIALAQGLNAFRAVSTKLEAEAEKEGVVTMTRALAHGLSAEIVAAPLASLLGVIDIERLERECQEAT